MVSARNLEAEVSEVDFKLRRGEGSGRLITSMGGAYEVLIGVGCHLAVHSFRADGRGGFAESGAFDGPLAKAI